MLNNAKHRRMVGPFTQPPHFIASPIGAFRRKQSGKVRAIKDLSYQAGHSINSGIDHKYCRLTYASVDDVVHKCQEIGGVSYLAKLDLASAFKSINVHTEDWHLLGSTWQYGDDKEYWYSTVLLFVLSLSPKLFDMFACALKYMMCKPPGLSVEQGTFKTVY